MPYRIAAYAAKPIPPRKTLQAPTEMLLPGKSKYARPVALVLNKTQASNTETTASCLPFLGDDMLITEPKFEPVTLIECQ